MESLPCFYAHPDPLRIPALRPISAAPIHSPFFFAAYSTPATTRSFLFASLNLTLISQFNEYPDSDRIIHYIFLASLPKYTGSTTYFSRSYTITFMFRLQQDIPNRPLQVKLHYSI